MAQYGEAKDIETHTETFRRQLSECDAKLSEWNAKWKELQEDLFKVKPGENMLDQFLEIRKKVIGGEKKQLVYGKKIFNVEMDQPRSVSKIEDPAFDFSDTACVSANS